MFQGKIITINNTPTITWLADTARQFEGDLIYESVNGKITVDNHFAKGRITAGFAEVSLRISSDLTNIPISYVIYQISVYEKVQINLIPDPSNDFFVIGFYKTDSSVQDITPSYKRESKTGVIINTSGTSHTIHLPAFASGEFFSITISKNWLQKHISSEHDFILHQMAHSEDTAIVFEIMSFEMQTKVKAIMSNKLSNFLERMELQEYINTLIRLVMEQVMRGQHTLSSTKLKQPDIESLVRAQELLLANLTEPPTIKSLANEAAMSETKFKTSFKTLYGRSVYDYYLHYRMEVARKWIDENKMNVTEIGQQLGYKNLSHFSRTFKKYFGEYPSRYRN